MIWPAYGNFRPTMGWGPIISRVSLVGLLACTLFSAAAAAESKRVMVLHSFGRDFKPWNEYARAIRTELQRQSPWPLEIVDHALISTRAPDAGPEAPFVEYLVRFM